MTGWRRALRAHRPLHLADLDARATPQFEGTKEEGQAELDGLVDALDELQLRLWAAKSHGLLVVLQGRDSSGKDGALRHVLGRMSPLGFSVRAFGVPTEIERAHDFLWRVHLQVPARGELVVFNRSHYEDVLVRRVHELDDEDQWRARFGHIRGFEQALADDADTVIVKIYLHISKEEQAERLQARLDDQTKRWKFRIGDLADRERWGDYDVAYEEAIGETDADHAPWFVIPADRKWYRDLAIAHVLHETLTDLDLQWPMPEEDLSAVEIT